MKKVISITVFGSILLAFSACTQDEIVGGDDSLLPDGAYPLKIGSVSIVAQSSEEPWTRVAENTTDGSSSVWETGDVIGVRLDGGNSYAGGPVSYTSKGKYSLSVGENNNVSLTPVPDEEVYFKNHYSLQGVYQYDYDYSGTVDDDETFYTGGVMAWYPAEDGVVQLADQSGGLAYILEGKMGSFPAGWNRFEYTHNIPLVFNHMLAKVRVKLEGNRASQVSKVEVFGYTSCTHGEVNYTKSTAPYRTISAEGAQKGWITMHKATEYGNGMYWEANLVPGEIGDQKTQPFVRLNGTTEVPINTLTELKAGNLHTVTVDVRAYPSDATQITAENAGNINGEGNYYVTGNLTSAINITGGSPHIYLYNANVTNSTGSAISITGGNPTIHVVGANNSVSSKDGAGIYVAQNATVTITGNSRNEKLTATGGGGGAGIGGYVISNNKGANCGNIKIGNVTVYSYGSRNNMGDISAGIGSASGASCGTITIDNATVHAYGTSYGNNIQYTPGIGCGYPFAGSPSAIPIVNISNQSEIHAHRGGVNTDYIGWAGDRGNITNANSTINLGGGTCTGSTVYCYTGTSTTTDTVVEY